VLAINLTLSRNTTNDSQHLLRSPSSRPGVLVVLREKCFAVSNSWLYGVTSRLPVCRADYKLMNKHTPRQNLIIKKLCAFDICGDKSSNLSYILACKLASNKLMNICSSYYAESAIESSGKIRHKNQHTTRTRQCQPSPCLSVNWNAWTSLSTSSIERPTGKSFTVIWRRMHLSSMMNKPLKSQHAQHMYNTPYTSSPFVFFQLVTRCRSNNRSTD